MSEIKRATSVEEQIEILKNRGIEINDEKKAKEHLLDIGYYRLGFYCFPFERTYPIKEKRDHLYKEGSRFSDIVHLYYFDVDLRNLFNRSIYRIEINFRTTLIYTVSNKYPNSPTWFADTTIISNNYANKFASFIYTDKFKTNPAIKHHHKKYINDLYAPAWKTIEYMTFGNILLLFQELKDTQLKLDIAKKYGFKSIKAFVCYMETIRILRNICAHNGVIFDLNLPKSVVDGPAGKMSDTKSMLSSAIIVLLYMLRQVSKNREKELHKQLCECFNKCPSTIQPIIRKCSGYDFKL